MWWGVYWPRDDRGLLLGTLMMEQEPKGWWEGRRGTVGREADGSGYLERMQKALG
jgi:hypothetical protein